MKPLFLLAGEVITNSKTHPSIKMRAIDWIQYEATEAQIKSFLLDGRIVEVDEQSEGIINDRFEASKVSYYLEDFNLFLTMLAHLGSMAVYRTIRARYDEKLRRCGVYSAGFKHSLCMLVAKREEISRKISVIQSSKSKCSETVDSRACEMVLQQRINKLQGKLKKYDEKLVQAKMKGKDVSGSMSKYKQKKLQIF